MLASLLLVPLLLGPVTTADDGLPRSDISERDLTKIGDDVSSFFQALTVDDRAEQEKLLEGIRTSLDRAARKARLDDDPLKYVGDFDVILEAAKGEDRELRGITGKGFVEHGFHEPFDDVTIVSLLSLPSEYGRDDARTWPVVVGLKPVLGERGQALVEQVKATAESLYAGLLDTHIVLIPIGRQEGEGRAAEATEVGTSWLTDEGLYAFFTAYRTLLEQLHFDRSRVVLDGWGEAGLDGLRLASGAPSFFAGMIDRAGAATAPDLILGNLATVPVLYVHGGESEVDLGPLGQAEVDVTELDGGDMALAPSEEAVAATAEWIAARQRDLAPQEIRFKTADPRFASVGWCQATVINHRPTARPSDTDFPLVHATVDRDSNTIDLETVNVLELRVYLSDAVVDLDRPVTIRVNGEDRIKNRTYQRSLRTLLINRFYNNSGDYGLYTASELVEDIDKNVPGD